MQITSLESSFQTLSVKAESSAAFSSSMWLVLAERQFYDLFLPSAYPNSSELVASQSDDVHGFEEKSTLDLLQHVRYSRCPQFWRVAQFTLDQQNEKIQLHERIPKEPVTLLQLPRFSPARLDGSGGRGGFPRLWLLYQLLRLQQFLSRNDLSLPFFSIDQFYVDEFLWLRLPLSTALRDVGRLRDWCQRSRAGLQPYQPRHSNDDFHRDHPECPVSTDQDLAASVQAWCEGRMENLDYLLLLNRVAGRRSGDPHMHPILPWTTDFTVPVSENSNEGLRDLTRTKYRLHKGDEQLDFTYSRGGHIAHHVPELLSELTYYLYQARRTPRTVLQRHVRQRWVPDEYPSSMQRLYKQTPDECIPEFYQDPAVIRSIHDDLPDLELPSWCASPEQFISYHRQVLESDAVSSVLHHWIDLTFGYKLSGQASIAAKNVCLSRIDGHTHVTSVGVSPIFTLPHPPRVSLLSAHQQTSVSRGVRSSIFKNYSTSDLSSFHSSSTSSLELDEGTAPQLPVDTSQQIEHTSSLIRFFLHTFGRLPEIRPSQAPAPSTSLLVSQGALASFLVAILQLYCTEDLPVIPTTSDISSTLHALAPLLTARFALLPREVKPVVETLFASLRQFHNMVCSVERRLPSSFLTDDHETQEFFYSPDLLLNPLIDVVPFPPYMEDLYELCERFQRYFNFDPTASLEELIFRFSQLLPQLSREALDLLMPLYAHLLASESGPQVVLATLTPVAAQLGREASLAWLLEPCLRLLNPAEPTPAFLPLFQTEFLQQLVLIFGQRIFLTRFSTALIEAAAGFRDFASGKRLSQNDSKGLLASESSEGFIDCPTSNSSSDPSDANIGWEASSSILALAATVGPLLTARFLTRNLLRMIPLCYLNHLEFASDGVLPTESLVQRLVTGDRFAAPCLTLLSRIAGVFGQQLIQLHYLPHLVDLVASCQQRLSQRAEAELVGALVTASHLLPYCAESTFLDLLQDKLLPDLLTPLLCLVSSNSLGFPSGSISRSLIVFRLVEFLHKIGLRIGVEMARHYLMGIFHRFFLSFDITYRPSNEPVANHKERSPNSASGEGQLYCEVVFSPIEIRVSSPAVNHTAAPPPLLPSPGLDEEPLIDDTLGSRDLGEIYQQLASTFTAELAFNAFVCFSAVVGNEFLESKLTNLSFVRQLIRTFADSRSKSSTQPSPSPRTSITPSLSAETDDGLPSSSPSGNRLYLRDGGSAVDSMFHGSFLPQLYDSDIHFSYVLEEKTERHLRGNWLAHWEHELGKSEKEFRFDMKQIHLQAFEGLSAGPSSDISDIQLLIDRSSDGRFSIRGHTGAIRSITLLEGENSFLSSGRDKAVRLWSLGNTGDGAARIESKFCYTGHRRPVNAALFMPVFSLGVSSDGAVHVWDPVTQKAVSQFEQVTNIHSLHLLSPLDTSLFAVGAEGLVRMFDPRSASGFAVEMRTSTVPLGSLKQATLSPLGRWAALGFNNGLLALLDLRSGLIGNPIKAHDMEILQLQAVNENLLLSSSLDGTLVARTVDAALNTTVYRTAKVGSDFVHSLDVCGEFFLAAAMTNKIAGVHSVHSLETLSGFQKLSKAEGFRGVITCLSMLPMNKQVLVGSDSGYISLFC